MYSFTSKCVTVIIGGCQGQGNNQYEVQNYAFHLCVYNSNRLAPNQFRLKCDLKYSPLVYVIWTTHECKLSYVGAKDIDQYEYNMSNLQTKGKGLSNRSQIPFSILIVETVIHKSNKNY